MTYITLQKIMLLKYMFALCFRWSLPVIFRAYPRLCSQKSHLEENGIRRVSEK